MICTYKDTLVFRVCPYKDRWCSTYISLEIRSSDKLKASLRRVIENYIIL